MLGHPGAIRIGESRKFSTTLPKMAAGEKAYALVVGPVMKIKTCFRCFETKQNPGFRKCAEI